MAMNGTVLGNAVAAALGITDTNAIAAMVTLCTQIVLHIQSNAIVAVSSTVPGTGLLAPTGGGPVTGVASGSGTGSIT